MWKLCARRRDDNKDVFIKDIWDPRLFKSEVDYNVDRDIYKEAIIINWDNKTCAFYQEFPIQQNVKVRSLRK